MTAEIFHLASPEEWARARREGRLVPPSLATEGFVHCSTRSQLAGTIERHFPDVDRLVLLALDAADLGDDLRWEESRPGEVYPHLYRPIDPDEVQRDILWERRPDGAVALPAELDPGSAAT